MRRFGYKAKLGDSRPFKVTYLNPSRARPPDSTPIDLNGANVTMIVENDDRSELARMDVSTHHVEIDGDNGSFTITLSDDEKKAYDGRNFRLVVTFADETSRLIMIGRVKLV
jgi:hypothetical protein